MRIYSLLASVWISASVGCGGSVDTADRSTNDVGPDSATSDSAPTDAARTDSASTDSMATDTAPPVPGGDVDVHGCIGSAGYQWCAKEMKCVRPWELASEKGFSNTAEEFARYCAG